MIYDAGFLAWVSDIYNRLANLPDDSDDYEPPENFVAILELQRRETRLYTHIDKELR